MCVLSFWAFWILSYVLEIFYSTAIRVPNRRLVIILAEGRLLWYVTYLHSIWKPFERWARKQPSSAESRPEFEIWLPLRGAARRVWESVESQGYDDGLRETQLIVAWYLSYYCITEAMSYGRTIPGSWMQFHPLWFPRKVRAVAAASDISGNIALTFAILSLASRAHSAWGSVKSRSNLHFNWL